jgi:hypothetical protein
MVLLHEDVSLCLSENLQDDIDIASRRVGRLAFVFTFWGWLRLLVGAFLYLSWRAAARFHY